MEKILAHFENSMKALTSIFYHHRIVFFTNLNFPKSIKIQIINYNMSSKSNLTDKELIIIINMKQYVNNEA